MREGWEIKKLVEVCKIKPPKKEVKETLNEDDLVSFVPMKDLSENSMYFEAREDKALVEVLNGYTYFADNDVILAKITPCFENGKLGIAKSLKNGVGFGSSEYIVYRATSDLLPEYLYYYLSQPSFREIGASRMTGAVGHKRIPKDFYEDAEIPVPPLDEQQRIVAILDEAFAAIDQARANIERNIANAEELFQSYKGQLFHEVSRNAESFLLPEVCDDIFAGGDAPKESFSNVKTSKFKIPIYANAVFDNGLYGFTDNPRVTRPSLTIAARGSGTGHTQIRLEPFVPIVRLIVLTPNEDKVLIEYLMHAILNLDILRSGSAIPQLTVPMIKGYSIPVPDLGIQLEIVERLNALDIESRGYIEILQQKLTQLDELKKSLLQQAFEGRLTDKEVAV